MLENLFLDILNVDSTSGREREMAEFLMLRLGQIFHARAEMFEVGDGTLNLLFSWGNPRVVLCTHMDTVPPYIAPSIQHISKGHVLPDGRAAQSDDILYMGRGTCDAKGQIISMVEACLRLQEDGATDFGLLLLAGEETGSYGAKAWTRDCRGFDSVIVGEPTENIMASASKGTKSFEVKIGGKPCHSGYPELGISAVDGFAAFLDALRAEKFAHDPVLGSTTWNIGKLLSDNPQNILSPELTFRIYFRTTFASDKAVCEFMREDNLAKIVGRCGVEVKVYGGDNPLSYKVLCGLPSAPVSFGSDAPRLEHCPEKSLCGPGTIRVAHTAGEYVLRSDLEKAAEQYYKMLKTI